MTKLRLSVTCVILFCAVTVVWGAKPDVTVVLNASLIKNGVSGKEVLVSGATAKPGEIIEYRAVYTNTGSAEARNLIATLPVPADMEYVENSATPGVVQASTDSKTYAAVPLKRNIKLANGTVSKQLVPLSEYRSLRWNLETLAAGSSKTVSARMKIRDNQKGPVIIKLDSLKKSEGTQKGGKK